MNIIDLIRLKKAVDMDTALREKTGYGVLSGLGVTAHGTPDMAVAVAAGVCHMISGLRFAPIAVVALTIGAVEALKNRAAIVYVSALGVVTALSAFGTTAVAGAKTFTIATNAVATDTVTIGGVAFTAVAEGATGAQFNVGVDTAATAADFAAVLGANVTIAAKYNATVVGAAITLTEKVPGGGDTPADATKTGTVAITNSAATTSAAAGVASMPSLPTGGVLLAEISVAAGATSIVAANIKNYAKKLNIGDWIKPELLNGWTEVAGYQVRYCIDQNGIVRFKGQVQAGTPGSPIFAVPAGYKPSKLSMFLCARGDNTTSGVQMHVYDTNGWVVCDVGGFASFVDLVSISYKAEG